LIYHSIAMAELSLVLEVTSPQGQSTRYELNASPLVIGRQAESDIQLDSPRVSRRHARLERCEGGQWLIRDLTSRNGTRVNGQPVTERGLSGNDAIEIGQFQLRLICPDEGNAPQPDAQTTTWTIDDPQGTEFVTLSSSPAPRLSASHLAKVNTLSQRLLDISDPRQRRIELCQTLVAPDMSCNCAVVLRIARGTAAPPQLLCPHQLRDGHAQPPGMSRAVVEAAIADQQPIVAGGEMASGLTVNFSESERGVTAVIACPLRIEPAWAEVLYATVPRHCGTLDWLALVALAAEQYKKTELQIEARKTTQDNAAITSDLKKARKMQLSLAPTSPTAPGLEIAIGFEPCHWIGGDYANVLPASDHRVFLIVADVCGKGLPAAMIATGVHSIVDASVREGQSLSEIAQGLNRFLIESMDRQSFLTLLAVLFDPRTGHAQYLNAGHPPMFIIAPDGKAREMASEHNTPLGVLATSPVIDFAELHPGELLFMYTDGLSEMHDSCGKMLQIDGVRSHIASLYSAQPGLPLTQLRDHLSERLDQLRGPSPVTDDRTFLLARRL
jgi:phosphoserine phosphatase RsbU/P